MTGRERGASVDGVEGAADGESRDGSPPSRTAVRAVLAFGVLAGLAYLAAVPLLRPDQVGLATDVYYHAATAALAGRDPYLVAPPDRPGYHFLYPPIVLAAFLPHAWTGSPLGAYLLQTVVNLATAGALAVAIVRSIERAGTDLARIDQLLIGAFVVGSVHSVPVLVMGQVNLQLALAVAVGAVLVERGRGAAGGAALALAATVKLFPAVAGAWLLRLRARRAVAAAAATGTGALLAGLAAFGPSATRTFLTETVPAERHAEAFAGGLAPEHMFVTVRRPLAAAFPDADPTLLGLAALAILVPVVAASYRDVSTRPGRLAALLATLLGALAYLPTEPFYYALCYYPLVGLLYALGPGRARRLLVAGTLLLSTIVTYPTVAGLLAVAPLPPEVAAGADRLARGVFRVVQPPLLGVALLLAACVRVSGEAAAGRLEGARHAGAADLAGD